MRIPRLLPLLAVLLPTVVAAGAAWFVVDGRAGWDRAGVRWAFTHHEGWLNPVMRTLTDSGRWYVVAPLAVIVVAWAYLRGVRAGALLFAISFVGAVVLNTLLKLAVASPRPLLAGAPHESTSSFPSGHAMDCAAFALGLLFVVRGRWRVPVVAVAVAWALAVGYSRMYLGVHHPTDVVAGWLLGGAWVALVHLVLGRRAAD